MSLLTDIRERRDGAGMELAGVMLRVRTALVSSLGAAAAGEMCAEAEGFIRELSLLRKLEVEIVGSGKVNDRNDLTDMGRAES